MATTIPRPPSAPGGHRARLRPWYGLDIETDTTVDGLDASVSAVVAAAVATADGDHVLMDAEPRLLGRLDDLLAGLEPGILVTWNGAGFDLPFLHERARRHGMVLGLRLWRDPLRAAEGVAEGAAEGAAQGAPVRGSWHHHDHLDGYRLYRADVGRSLGLPCGLKAMARLVGMTPVEVDRSTLHLLDPSEVHDYVASDARLARELVMRRGPVAARAADGCHRRVEG